MQHRSKKRHHSSSREGSHKRMKSDRVTKEEEEEEADWQSNTKIQDLPSCLLLQIFLFLGLRDVYRMRAVCKLWNSLLGSDGFTGMWKTQEKSSVFSQETYRECGIRPSVYQDFCGIEPLSCWSVDGLFANDDGTAEEECYVGEQQLQLQVWHPQSGVRRRISAPGLPAFHPPFCPCMNEGTPYASMEYAPDPCFTFLASGEGLVCGHLKKEPGLALAVGNPVTRAWKRLPPVLDFPLLREDRNQLCALMQVDTVVRPGYRYKILLFPQIMSHRNMIDPFWLLIYDSEDDRWEVAPKFESSSLPCHIFSMGIPFLFPYAFSSRRHTPLNIAAFDVATRSWSARTDARAPRELSHWPILGVRVFPYQGKCILIAVGHRCDFFLCAAWLLEEQSNVFKLLSKMCKRLKGKWKDYAFRDKEPHRLPFKLVTDGHLVVVSPEVADHEVWPVVAYNLELSMWTMMRKPRPQFAYDRLCILSPSLWAEP